MMKLFQQKEIREAFEYAKNGGQALHLFTVRQEYNKRPSVQRLFAHAGKNWAHLIDHDEKRLRETVKQLGVNRVFIHGKGTEKQHVDLCGKPLEKAKAICDGR